MARENIQIQVTEDVSIKGTKIIGKNKGKTLLVTAGVHGCEYVGIQALRELIKEIDDNELFGIKEFLSDDYLNNNFYLEKNIFIKCKNELEKVLFKYNFIFNFYKERTQE